MKRPTQKRAPYGAYIFDLDASRILAIYDRAREALAGRIPAPRMAIIYPNHICNFRCVGCEYEVVNNKKNVHIEHSRLMRLLEELRELGVDSIEFSGGGEPTLYPELEQTIRRARSLGFSVGMLTNGSNISGTLAETVLRELSYVRVSLAASKTHKQPHRQHENRNPGDVFENIRGLLRGRSTAGTPLLISIKFLVSKDNYREVPATFRIAQELGVDSIQFKAMRQNPKELTPRLQKHVSAQIEELRAGNSGLKVLGGVEKIRTDCRCWLTPLQTTIDASGDVFLCNYYLHRRARHRIGNIYKQSFREIWESPRHAHAIDTIRPDECNLFDCRFVRYMELLEPIISDHGHQIDFI